MSEPLSKIINRAYPDRPADLLDAVPDGPVAGYQRNNNSNNQSWAIVSVGGDFITIQNGTTYTYANPSAEQPGAEVVGNPNQYRWQQLSVPSGGWYQIATNDGEYVWRLPNGNNRTPIILEPISDAKGKDAQWGYDPTDRVGRA